MAVTSQLASVVCVPVRFSHWWLVFFRKEIALPYLFSILFLSSLSIAHPESPFLGEREAMLTSGRITIFNLQAAISFITWTLCMFVFFPESPVISDATNFASFFLL